jgi:hypothetical protein
LKWPDLFDCVVLGLRSEAPAVGVYDVRRFVDADGLANDVVGAVAAVVVVVDVPRITGSEVHSVGSLESIVRNRFGRNLRKTIIRSS